MTDTGVGRRHLLQSCWHFSLWGVMVEYVQGIWCGSYEYLNTMKVRDERKLTSIPNKKHLQSALKKLEMGE